MKKLMITAMNSGSGKTMVTCTLLAALKKRGMDVQSFKCGPDYIDPMFHRTVLETESCNIDLFLEKKADALKRLNSSDCELALFEGAMGYYDGLAGTTDCSAFETSVLADTSAVLVVAPKGSSITLAAQIKGLLQFRDSCRIRGVILNCCSERLYEHLQPIIEKECDIRVLGYLPKISELEIGSRHLGLVTADEISALRERFFHAAEKLEQTCDIELLLSLCTEQENIPATEIHIDRKCTIAVADARAFCFRYDSSLSALEKAGAEIVYFSPVSDSHLPECDGLYLCGGYPELYAEALSKNSSMIEDIRTAVTNGVPTVAECGGFMYLQKELEGYPMVGVFNGVCVKKDRLQRFGYCCIESNNDSMLFRKGEKIPVHEFHYYDTDSNGNDLICTKLNGKSWQCGYASDNLYAGFPHLMLNDILAQRFVDAIIKFKGERNEHK